MLASVKEYFPGIIVSRLGWILTILNWTVILFCYLTRDNTQQFHFYYEPVLFQIIIVINIPAIVVAGLLALLLGYNDSIGEKNWSVKVIVFLGFVFSITLQWLLIGYRIEKYLKNKKTRRFKENL